ncbi:CLUMA_CG015133, isoform A [Clunio marinus]|uniref:CLUMA_CG015133, isoform A n=1 Tax=Clunio marinus TaxID=568069 RepID=A0A1J1IT13_9DIPT|nr:CLUMA_CG015133, isoform A [Clunio marinus]
MSNSEQYGEKATVREWKRAIPQAGYIKLGALRYGIRISNLNLSDYSSSNKPQMLSSSTQRSLIMSPSTETISAKAICNDGCCCCLSSKSSQTKLSLSQSAKNRTSSPSSTSSQQPTNIVNKNSVSSSSFKREASPTVCCYNTNGRSQTFRKSDKKEGNFDTFISTRHEEKIVASNVPNQSSNLVNLYQKRSHNQQISLVTNRVPIENYENVNTKTFSYLKDKIKKLENSPNNIHENIINRSTTSITIRAEETTVDVDPVISVSENDQRIYDDKNSRFGSTRLINRDESQSKKQCNLGVQSDGNNNQVNESRIRSENSVNKVEENLKSSLITRQLRDINTHCHLGVNGDDIKVTKVVIKHLTSDVRKNPPIEDSHMKNSLDDNDFSYIDSSSRSVSRSSSTSFASDDLDEKINQRKNRISKIGKFNNNNYSKECFNTKSSANHNKKLENYLSVNDWDTACHRLKENLEKSNIKQHFQVSENSFSSLNINQSSVPEQSPTMDKTSRNNTLKRFGFGRKSSPTTSSSPDRKVTSSKTERLKELTEKLKGHKTGSFKLNSSRSVSPPVPPPLPSPPIPPPRKLKRNSQDNSAASSLDNLLSGGSSPSDASTANNQNLHQIGKSKSVEPSSIFSRQLKSIQERFLRPNISASNLEALNSHKEYLKEDKKINSESLKDDFFTKLSRPESRTIVGSYTQKSIPFRSASFSQADVVSGKYIKSDIASLRASIAHSKSKNSDRSPSPKKKPLNENKNKKYTLTDDANITNESEENLRVDTSNRNSEIDTITEDPMAEILAEEQIKNKVGEINVVQANEMVLETLIEEESPAMHVLPKIQTSELQQAMTCIIPIPVFECVEKEWSLLPEHGGEEFCHPISEDVLPQAKVIENFIEVRLNKELEGESLDKHDQNSFNYMKESDLLPRLDLNENVIQDENNKVKLSISPTIPEVEINSVALQLDEITEKLKEIIPPQSEVCNVVKTQIPQDKSEFIAQKSIDSSEEIQISPEIQEVLETVAETLNEEHKFLKNVLGNNNINIVSLICPEQEQLTSNEKEAMSETKFDSLKATDSSPEPGSFDKSDSEFTETVRKRHSNDTNSGSEKSSPNISSPNINNDDKRKIDKSRRRKGIYIQWPAIEGSQDVESFDSSTVEDIAENERQDTNKSSSAPLKSNEKKLSRSHNLDFCFSEPIMPRQSESLCSLEPYTPDSDYNSNKPLQWPQGHRRQSLTYQSSDERDDPSSASLHPIKCFRNIFIRSDSISDNESDRGSSRDRGTSSPASANEQDLKRYSKRPLRGPYGQMLEAEMKKPTKVHYDGILEELSRNDSMKKSNCSLDSITSRSSGFFNRVSKSRKNAGGSLPVPMHQRTASSPVPLIETTSPDALPMINHKRYPSSVDQRVTDTSDRLSFKNDNKKFSFDSSLLSVEKLSPKRTSSDTTSEKHSKKSFNNDKLKAKKNLDEIRIPTTPLDKALILNTPETPKSVAATPELLAELLKGSSEKLLNEQNHSKKHQSRNNISSSGMSLPTAVLNSLNSLDTRTHVVVELFNTEKNYVESLQTIVTKYLNPLKLPENSAIVDLQTVDEIFFMVPSILNIHEKFLEELKKRLDSWDALQRVGDAYCDVFTKPIVLETYTSFVNNWNKAEDAIRTTKTARPAFAKFLETTAREHKGKLSLDNLLIKIIQKFPNYELMFQRLTKHTEPDHPDYTGCSEALKLVHDILVHLNCKKREATANGQREATLRELENVIEGISDLVSTDRTFLSFEIISMPSGQAGRKERGLFLFSDLLVLTGIKKRSGTIRKPNSISGSFALTLDTNKYKFLTRLQLDDIEIVKSRDENVRRIMKEIEHLTEDSNKLQQIFDLTTSLRCPHQTLEESIRDLQANVQRQLAERQANDSPINILELSFNGGTQNLTLVFSKPDKRAQWEEIFTEAKQKLVASAELTSCNGVCNARILCVTSVPGYSESLNVTNNLNSSINSSIDDNRSSTVSISNTSTISNKTSGIESTQSETNSQHDSVSSSDSEPDTTVDRSVSPSTVSKNCTQNPICDETESQMWLGTEDGFIHVYNCTDNIRIKKNKIKIQHSSAVCSILYLDNRVFVALANGDICVYSRESSPSWNIHSPIVLSLGSMTCPVTKLLNVYGKLWCSIQGVIKVLNSATLQVENNVEISNDSKPISNMTLLNNYVWISMQNSATILCCNVNNLKIICEVNLAPAVNKMLSNCDNIIQQHKAACLRVTSLLACKDIIWIGTSAGVLLTILVQNIGKSTPIVTGITQGHTGHVRFLTLVEINDVASIKRILKNCETPNEDTNFALIISGGDGYEDFRTSGTSTMNEVAGREDSTNHLLMWQQVM